MKKNGFLAKIGIFAALASMFHAKAKFEDREKAVAQSGRTRGGRTRRATRARGSGRPGAPCSKLGKKMRRARSNQGWIGNTKKRTQIRREAETSGLIANRIAYAKATKNYSTLNRLRDLAFERTQNRRRAATQATTASA